MTTPGRWLARAAGLRISERALPGPDKTDESPFVSSVGGKVGTFSETGAVNDPVPAASRWLIHFTDRDPVEVTFDPPADHGQALAYPGAIAAAPLLEPVVPEPECVSCRHVSVFGNCAAPAQAGLADRFTLVWHADGGRGCSAFEHEVTAIERRLRRLLVLGAIDADDAQLCRRRYQDDPTAWDVLLDACEAAGRGLRPRR